MTRRPSAEEPQDPSLAETRVHSTVPVGRLQRVEERLVPKVTEVQAGAVRIRKRVVEEREEVEVTLRHDELQLDRRKANRALGPDEQPVTERGDTTVVLVIEERLEVRRVPWVVEEIHLTRGIVSEQRTVADMVRKERIDIDTKGDVELKHRE